jgi:hypothetical protein
MASTLSAAHITPSGHARGRTGPDINKSGDMLTARHHIYQTSSAYTHLFFRAKLQVIIVPPGRFPGPRRDRQRFLGSIQFVCLHGTLGPRSSSPLVEKKSRVTDAGRLITKLLHLNAITTVLLPLLQFLQYYYI